MPSVDINGSLIEIKNKLTLGHMKKINRSFGQSLGQDAIPDLISLTPEEFAKVKPKLETAAKFNEAQLELVCDIIKHSFGMTDEDLEKIPFDQVESIYNAILLENQPKKKLNQQYA